MQRTPRWRWLTVGLAVGASAGWVLTLGAVRGADAVRTPAWQEGVAWQGWVGSVIGAVVSVLVAVHVLRETLGQERQQFERQLDAGRGQFERQLELSREMFAEQIEKERRLAFEQRRVDAWASLVVDLRTFLRLSVDREAVLLSQRRATASFFRWRLYTEESDEDVVAGVKRAIEKVIGAASGRATEMQLANDHIHPDDPAMSVTSNERTSRLIVEIIEYGEALHTRSGVRNDEAREWFLSHVE